MLLTYVKLVIVSPCAQWHSCAQEFVICPNLQSNLILGLNFLEQNHIVVNTWLHSAINTRENFNLLHPPVRQQLPIEPHITQKLKKKAAAKKRAEIHVGQEEVWKKWKMVHFELDVLFARKRMQNHWKQDSTSMGEPLLLGLICA